MKIFEKIVDATICLICISAVISFVIIAWMCLKAADETTRWCPTETAAPRLEEQCGE